jgi:transcription termination factor NusB
MENETQAPKPSVAVKSDVAALLANSGGTVREIVVKQLAQAEINKRTESVMKVLTKIDDKHNELKKLQRQGAVSFNASGQPIGEPSFTKDQVEQIKKANEHIEKLQKALDTAFTTSDFSKLHEVANQG